jgi:hypothetical protein
MEKNNKKKKGIIILVIIGIALIGLLTYRNIKEKDKIINTIMDVADEYNLENVEIEFINIIRTQGKYMVKIYTPTFIELFPNEMFELGKAMENVCEKHNTLVASYESSLFSYEVNTSTQRIYKNGVMIIDNMQTIDKNDLINFNFDTSSSKITEDEKNICWGLALKAVKAKLKSPSSAKFPFSYASDSVTITKSGSTYYVNAWVEADNSFGANLRSDFKVTIEKSGSDFSVSSVEIY